MKSFATLEGDPESAKLTEHEFEDVLTALAEAELIVGRLHGKGYTLGGNLQNIYVCPCQLAGAGRSPVKKILAVYPPSHGTSMHNPRLKSDPAPRALVVLHSLLLDLLCLLHYTHS